MSARRAVLPVPLSVRLADFHRQHRDWHERMSRAHAERGHEQAELEHSEAAAAHEAAASAPLDGRLARAAMRASSFADEASQKAGVRPLRAWPAAR